MQDVHISHESGGGSINDLISRMPAGRDEAEIVSWLIDLFDIWNGGCDGRVAVLRGDIAARMGVLYRFSPGTPVSQVPPEGHTMRGRWLIQFAVNTLANTGHESEPLARDCQLFLEYARAWMYEV